MDLSEENYDDVIGGSADQTNGDTPHNRRLTSSGAGSGQIYRERTSAGLHRQGDTGAVPVVPAVTHID